MAVIDHINVDFGRRLIPNVIDEIAEKDPQRECFSVPRSSNPQDGWEMITFKAYANAINYICHVIIEKCGKPLDGSFPTLAYIGPNDAGYVILLVAGIKTGYKALFISPRNSQEAQMNLFNETDCQFICFPRSHRTTVEPWLQQRNMQPIELEPTKTWFPSHEIARIPYNKSFEQAEWEPLAVLHTSGSTGLPKPVVIKQGMLAIGDAYHNLPDWNGRPTFIRLWSEQPTRQFAPFPFFHAGGLYMFIQRVIYWGNPVALGIVDRPLSSELVVDCLSNVEVEGASLPLGINKCFTIGLRFGKALMTGCCGVRY
ncbi:hypothetical protein F5Y06DRAFT_294493 [Hypoxylon sp. FL0890]|nr:hypothetical protein F5Y06DRAFT_294493 [Hypoxylon sp. FL0890]